jgi:hypothetical protein
MPDPARLIVLADKEADLDKAIKQLTSTTVAVGIPNAKTSRKKGSMTNSVLGYLFEVGSPATNMPARPWLNPGIKESQSKWIPFLRQAAEAALAGNLSAMTKAFNAAGLTAVSAVKSRIQSKIPPPLKPSTIRGRFRRRGQKVPKDFSAADVTPLIDTGQFINSINYVVRKKSS